jgi:hypothetical protein
MNCPAGSMNHFVATAVPMLAVYCDAHIQARECAAQRARFSRSKFWRHPEPNALASAPWRPTSSTLPRAHKDIHEAAALGLNFLRG